MGLIRKILRDLKRGVIIFLAIVITGSIIYTIVTYGGKNKKIKFSAILDSDSGNGIDDLFAISRILAEPGFDLIGLTSSHFNFNSDKYQHSAGISQEINETILKLFNREYTPNFSGGEPVNIYSGKKVFTHSEAAGFIVRKAHEVSKNKKLNIITLGALTNVASAVLMDSSIIPKIRVYSLAMQYNNTTKVWNKNEFNARNDLDALDLILNSDELEMHIMPVSVAGNFIIDSASLHKIMRNEGLQWDFLLDQWFREYPGEKVLSLPGLALIESLMNPDFVKVEQTITPPENNRKTVHVITWINKDFMEIDFTQAIQKFIRNHKKNRNNSGI